MRGTDAPSRGPAIAAATTTLVALVAMASAYPVATGPGPSRGATGEMAAVRGETPTVRAVAAVMAAVARDLLAGTTPNATLPASVRLDEPAPTAETGLVVASRSGSGRPSLAERLLDLPPPC